MERSGIMPEIEITLKVNGRTLKWRVQPGDTLLEALHAHHLKGTKLICGTGDCCGCGVILNGNSINSCCMLAAQADSGDLLTIEGLAQEGKLHPRLYHTDICLPARASSSHGSGGTGSTGREYLQVYRVCEACGSRAEGGGDDATRSLRSLVCRKEAWYDSNNFG